MWWPTTGTPAGILERLVNVGFFPTVREDERCGHDCALTDTATRYIPEISGAPCAAGLWPLLAFWRRVLASSSKSACASAPSRTSASSIGGRPLSSVQRRVRGWSDNVVISSDDDGKAFLEAHEVDKLVATSLAPRASQLATWQHFLDLAWRVHADASGRHRSRGLAGCRSFSNNVHAVKQERVEAGPPSMSWK